MPSEDNCFSALPEIIRCSGQTVAAALFFLFIAFSCTTAAYGANTTIAGTVTAEAEGTTAIRLFMPYAGDDNASNTYTVDYKTCAASTWTNWVTNAAHTASPYTTAISGLINNQCYTVRTTYADSDGISGSNPQTIQISAGWDLTLLHNSNRFPGTTKWSGDWGTPTGQYGQIDCETCHTRSTANIKRVKDSVITAPNSPAQRFSAETEGKAPVFQSTTTPNGFGDDTGGHVTSQKICEVCHSATSYHRYNTSGQSNLDHNNNTDCITCHPHSLGFKDASACNSCHGAPPGSGTDTNAPAVYAASHARHYNAVSGGLPSSYTSVANRSTAAGYVFDCGICHSSNNADHLANQDGTVDLKLPTGGTYAPGSYAGGDNPLPPGSVTFKNSGGTCSNVYCHGNYPGSGKNATPAWGSAASSACGTCHNGSNSVSPASGSHTVHSGGGEHNYACTMCHKGIIGGTGPSSYTVNDKAKHANGSVEWSFDPADARVNGASAAYSIASGTVSPSDGTVRTYGTCNNLYCHSIVQTSTGGALAPDSADYKPLVWGGTSVCNSCHDTGPGVHYYNNPAPAGAPWISSGSHSKHLSYIFTITTTIAPGDWIDKCAVCHSTGNGSLDPNYCTKCHNGYPDPSHANGVINIRFADLFGGVAATYNDPTGAPANGFANCSNTYCHSNGTSVSTSVVPANTSPTWGAGVQACDSCHGGTATGPAYANGFPKKNSHNKHVVQSSYACVDCHDLTVDASNNIPSFGLVYHLDKAYNVRGAKITGYTFAADGGTCSTQCHSDGKGNYAAPAWGGLPMGCTGCHGFAPNSGAHASHIQNAGLLSQVYGSTEVVSNAANYAFGCGNCHPTDSANHGNGIVDLSLNPADGGPLKSRNSGPSVSGTGAALQCNGIYCHSNGMGSPTFAQTPQWGSTFTAGACSGCHGNSPNSAGQPVGSAAHGMHVVGIHFDNIYNGTSGLAAAGTPVSASHGSAASSTTINCNICHYNTVSTAANDLNAICVNCHNGIQATERGIAVIADKSFHINGTPDIALQTIQVKSKSQLRDDITTVNELNSNWSRSALSYKAGAAPNDTAVSALNTATMWTVGTKTCSNVACHNGRSVAWTESVNCRSCHTQLPQ